MGIPVGLIAAFVTAHRIYFEIVFALYCTPTVKPEPIYESKPVRVDLSKERTTAKVQPSKDVQLRLKRIMERREKQATLSPHEIEINY